MEMTIENLDILAKGLECMGDTEHAEDIKQAIKTMRKYQKIKQIVDKWNEGIYDDEGLSHTEVMELVSDEVYEDENID